MNHSTPSNSTESTEKIVLVYSRFNRLWHWSQVISIIILLFTGFRIAGLHHMVPFGFAVTVHTVTALALVILWIFIFFWLLTTGTWKQYLPTSQGMMSVIRYYSFGVFKGEEHPYHRLLKRRLNPLQAASYFALNVVLVPVIWLSGILYLARGLWADTDPGSTWLTLLANIHLLTAFGFAAFIIVHVYMLTMGHGFKHHVRPMITGYDKIGVTKEELAYLEQDEPEKLKKSKHT